MRLSDMSRDDIELAAERYYDAMLDRYLADWDVPDWWERDNPDWRDIADLLDGQGWEYICDTIRDYIDGDGDIMMEIWEAGLLDSYIHPSHPMNDPDECWQVVDRTMDEHWADNDLMKAIYLWLPEEHVKEMCERLIQHADTNGIRDLYNEANQDRTDNWED